MIAELVTEDDVLLLILLEPKLNPPPLPKPVLVPAPAVTPPKLKPVVVVEGVVAPMVVVELPKVNPDVFVELPNVLPPNVLPPKLDGPNADDPCPKLTPLPVVLDVAVVAVAVAVAPGKTNPELVIDDALPLVFVVEVFSFCFSSSVRPGRSVVQAAHWLRLISFVI